MPQVAAAVPSEKTSQEPLIPASGVQKCSDASPSISVDAFPAHCPLIASAECLPDWTSCRKPYMFPSEEMGPGEGGGADSQELEYSGGQKDQRLCEPPCLQYYFLYSPSHGVSTADLELASTSRARGSTNVT